MKSLIADWIGRHVAITLRATTPAPLKGTVVDVDHAGLLLKLPKGLTFIPVTSILHVSLDD